MEAVFQANSLVFALCDLALYLFLLICGMDFKLFGIGMCSNSVASPDSQAFCCKTGLLPSVFFFCVFSGCIVCCSICISYLFSFLQADKVGGAFFDTWLSFHCEFLSAPCSHLNYTVVQ